MIFVETTIFTKSIIQLSDDDQYREPQELLIRNPEIGDLIQGSGGIRKTRWTLTEQAKQGGVRVVY